MEILLLECCENVSCLLVFCGLHNILLSVFTGHYSMFRSLHLMFLFILIFRQADI